MFTASLIYITLALATLAVLTGMILTIGKMLGDCPGSNAAARSASVTIATGYAAIGAGAVLLIGSALPVLSYAVYGRNAAAYLFPFAPISALLGFAALCLGLGFANAVATLRAVLKDSAARAA